MPFFAIRSSTDIPNFCAMSHSVSPDTTVYVWLLFVSAPVVEDDVDVEVVVVVVVVVLVVVVVAEPVDGVSKRVKL